MGWLSTAMAVLKMIGKFVGFLFERQAEIKKKKAEALKEVANGIKKKDPSRITAGFDRINRVR